MNRSRIEWCDHTWNPVTGCRHGCPYCYARIMAARFAGDIRMNLMAKDDYYTVDAADGSGVIYVLDKPVLNETGSPLTYPFGFAPTLYKYRMDNLDRMKMGNNIFVGAMADIFGDWVPEEIVKIIFSSCMERQIHNYLFLTKNPERYEILACKEMLPQGDNFWYGSTLTKPEDKCFLSKLYNTFWSIEPIHAPFNLMQNPPEIFPKWVIIGAETGRRKERIIPQREWIEDIVAWCKSEKIPVFMKDSDSLRSIVGEENIYKEYPYQLQRKTVSPKVEKRLYSDCASCKTHMKKNDMVTLLAKTGRGKMPKQCGFMCKECFKRFCRELGLLNSMELMEEKEKEYGKSQ